MYPGRFWLAVGTGQALNEHITADGWPEKRERQARLREAVDIMRALWAGEIVTHYGKVRIEAARLYSLPQRPPLLLGAATTQETAKWLGGSADGLLTVNAEPEELRKLVEAYRSGGGEAKPMFLQAAVGYDTDEERAWQAAVRNWPIAVLKQDVVQNLRTPEQFKEATTGVSVESLKGRLRVSADLGQHAAWIARDLELGFDRIFLYTVSGAAEKFIDSFGEKVLPACQW